MRRHQQGMTMIGMLCILAMAGLIGYAGLRLAPVYLNYLKVSRAMDAAAGENKGDAVDASALRATLAKHWEIDMIESPDVKEIEIVKDEGSVSMHIAYDDSVPYIGNVALTVHFDKTVKFE